MYTDVKTHCQNQQFDHKTILENKKYEITFSVDVRKLQLKVER